MTGAEFEGVDFDLLADFVGGALDGTPDEERVATLVAEDPRWQAAFDMLAPAVAAVGGALSAFDPEPMPAELADRLDTLLRAPSSAAPGEPLPADAAPGKPLPADAAPGEPLAADATSAGPLGADASPAEPLGGVPAKVVDLESRRRARRWAKPLAVAAAVIVFAGFGATWWVSGDSAGSEDAASTSAVAERAQPNLPFAVTSSGLDYTAATLADVPMSATMAGETGLTSPEKPAAAAPKSSVLARLDAPAELSACLAAITTENSGGTITVETVDFARFEGTPAVVVRFSAANGGWVWAVGADCGLPGAGADTVRNLPVR